MSFSESIQALSEGIEVKSGSYTFYGLEGAFVKYRKRDGKEQVESIYKVKHHLETGIPGKTEKRVTSVFKRRRGKKTVEPETPVEPETETTENEESN